MVGIFTLILAHFCEKLTLNSKFNHSTMKKLLFLFCTILLLTGCNVFVNVDQSEDETDQPLVGGDKDEHGCIGSAGYQWCPSQDKCMRMWEEYCEEFKDQYRGNEKSVTNFKECEEAGNPVMESYPQQCAASGQTFVEDIGNELEKTDLIRIDAPRPNQVVNSPLIIKGQARGTWFFEGSFPVKLLNADGREIAVGYVTAKTDWMTEDFVEFAGELKFSDPGTDTGTLILQKDNPSGLPENADELRVPVKF